MQPVGAARGRRGRRHEELRAFGERVSSLDPSEVRLDRGDPPFELRDRPAERAPKRFAAASGREVGQLVGNQCAPSFELTAGRRVGVRQRAFSDAQRGALAGPDRPGHYAAPFPRELDGLEPHPHYRGAFETRAPERVHRLAAARRGRRRYRFAVRRARGLRRTHRVPDARAPCGVEHPDAQSRSANEVHGLAWHANLEEGDLAAALAGDLRDPDALQIPPIELGLHLSRGAIA